MNRLSIIIPSYNSQATIGDVITRLGKHLGRQDHEIIIVDDGSPDRTSEVCATIARTKPNIKFLSFFKNFGQISAIMAGLREADGDVCIIMDDDLQNPP